MVTKILGTSQEEIEAAGEILRSGGLVAIPTETVYGLGADALNPEAVKKIFMAKGRPCDNPLIVHIAHEEQLYELVLDVPSDAKKLMKRFWPGPLTVILPKKACVPKETSGGLETVAVRLPSNKIARAIIAAAKTPIAAPSANTSGLPSPTDSKHVVDDMSGKIDAIVDGGECEVGVESTVVSFAQGKCRLLRPGGITLEMLCSCIGEVDVDDAVFDKLEEGKTASSPGMKYKHYSPKANVTIVKGSFENFKDFVNKHLCDGSYALCYDGEEKQISMPCVSFGKKGDPSSQAHILFSALRELDEKGAKQVYTRCPKLDGMGMAVYNRLIRAAAYEVVDLTKPLIIGLTGPTGAGKGYVGGLLKNYGFAIVDTDKIAREITKKDANVLKKLQAAFGDDIINDGILNRKLLAQRAFGTKEKERLLNNITHPKIIEAALKEIEELVKNGHDKIMVDAPLLFESEMDKICDKTLCVLAREDVRRERIISRDSLTTEQADVRMKAQPSDDFYSSKSDFVIYNNNENGTVKKSVEEIISLIGGINYGKD